MLGLRNSCAAISAFVAAGPRPAGRPRPPAASRSVGPPGAAARACARHRRRAARAGRGRRTPARRPRRRAPARGPGARPGVAPPPPTPQPLAVQQVGPRDVAVGAGAPQVLQARLEPGRRLGRRREQGLRAGEQPAAPRRPGRRHRGREVGQRLLGERPVAGAERGLDEVRQGPGVEAGPAGLDEEPGAARARGRSRPHRGRGRRGRGAPGWPRRRGRAARRRAGCPPASRAGASSAACQASSSGCRQTSSSFAVTPIARRSRRPTASWRSASASLPRAVSDRPCT